MPSDQPQSVGQSLTWRGFWLKGWLGGGSLVIHASLVLSGHYTDGGIEGSAFSQSREFPGMVDTRRRLLWHGLFLFFLGLCTGFVEQQFSNPRMGLAAHLEGVMNGTLLLVVGAVWMDVHLSLRTKAIAYWAVLYGAYANWGVTTLAAILGTTAMSVVTGAGHAAAPWEERLVTAGFVSVGVAIIVAVLLMLWGLRQSAVDQ